MSKLPTLLIASIFASVSVAAVAAEDVGSNAKAKHEVKHVAKKATSHKVKHDARKKPKHKAKPAMAKDFQQGTMN